MSKIKPTEAPFTFIDDEEREIYEAVENDEYTLVSILTPERKLEIMAMARAKMNESRVKISLRLQKTDLERLKARAMREGMPYQTLINSILHKAISR